MVDSKKKILKTNKTEQELKEEHIEGYFVYQSGHKAKITLEVILERALDIAENIDGGMGYLERILDSRNAITFDALDTEDYPGVLKILLELLDKKGLLKNGSP